jgi:hypothetical protein
VDDALHVLDGLELPKGDLNTPDAELVANIAHSIRLQYPQVKLQPNQPERICLIGGGPSLEDTEPELRELYYQGAKVVTVNGAYHWCLERNYRVSAQIVLDARASNARFVDPAVPNCRYLLASQCHPETWAAVAGRDVWIWHAVSEENAWRAVLDSYYGSQWQSIVGGVTVGTRAITLLRTLGFLRMDLFGMDSCWMDHTHHAYPQTENDRDRRLPVDMFPTGHPELSRRFWCAPWHLKQFEDFLQMVRINGHLFLLNVHGDGLLAYAMKSMAQVEWSVGAAAGGTGSESEST